MVNRSLALWLGHGSARARGHAAAAVALLALCLEAAPLLAFSGDRVDLYKGTGCQPETATSSVKYWEGYVQNTGTGPYYVSCPIVARHDWGVAGFSLRSVLIDIIDMNRRSTTCWLHSVGRFGSGSNVWDADSSPFWQPYPYGYGAGQFDIAYEGPDYPSGNDYKSIVCYLQPGQKLMDYSVVWRPTGTSAAQAQPQDESRAADPQAGDGSRHAVAADGASGERLEGAELDRSYQARMEDEFRDERLDLSWSRASERSISDTLADGLPARVAVKQLECRQHSCRVELAGEQGPPEFGPHLLPWPSSFRTYVPELDPWRLVVHIQRAKRKD